MLSSKGVTVTVWGMFQVMDVKVKVVVGVGAS